MTFDDLAAVIETAGYRVAMPGELGGALPAVQLVPRGMELHPGNRFAYHVVDVVVLVPLTPYASQFAALEAATVEVLHALTGTQFQLAATIRHDSDPDASPAYQSNVIDVRFHGPDIC